jgi:hypothetical protein
LTVFCQPLYSTSILSDKSELQENLVEVGEEEFEEYVGNPVNSLALVKRLSIELDKAGQMLIDHQHHLLNKVVVSWEPSVESSVYEAQSIEIIFCGPGHQAFSP